MAYVVEAAIDTLRMMPLLLIVLIAIEALEHRLGGRLERDLSRLGRFGPAIGAGIGALPQCGGAVVASELYAARALTLGTLLAVYLSTSDEALPILVANPAKISTLGPLLLTKIIIGLVAGYATDLVLRSRSARDAGAAHNHNAQSHVNSYENRACLEGRIGAGALFVHALRRGARVAAFLVVTTAALNWAGDTISGVAAGGSLLPGTATQVLASASFGLIPSCAPSVALTDLFIKGALGYPALIAGLCANAGAGLMVLLHESGWRTVLRVVGLLFAVSVASGLIVSLI